MRTKTLLIAAAALSAGLFTASAQNVYSLNVVGYVNTVFKGNSSYTLVANPLNASTNDLNTIMSSALPNKSSVTTFDGVNYTTYGKAGGAWPAVIIPPGTGFFVRNLAATDITNTFVGEVAGGVPGTNTMALPAGFSLVGSMFPVGGDINGVGPNTLNISAALPNKASITVYDNTTPPGTYTTLGKAGGAFPAYSMNVGQGFYVRTLTAGSNWVQVVTNTP